MYKSINIVPLGSKFTCMLQVQRIYIVRETIWIQVVTPNDNVIPKLPVSGLKSAQLPTTPRPEEHTAQFSSEERPFPASKPNQILRHKLSAKVLQEITQEEQRKQNIIAKQFNEEGGVNVATPTAAPERFIAPTEPLQGFVSKSSETAAKQIQKWIQDRTTTTPVPERFIAPVTDDGSVALHSPSISFTENQNSFFADTLKTSTRNIVGAPTSNTLSPVTSRDHFSSEPHINEINTDTLPSSAFKTAQNQRFGTSFSETPSASTSLGGAEQSLNSWNLLNSWQSERTSPRNVRPKVRNEPLNLVPQKAQTNSELRYDQQNLGLGNDQPYQSFRKDQSSTGLRNDRPNLDTLTGSNDGSYTIFTIL